MEAEDRLRAVVLAVIVVFAALVWPVHSLTGDAGIQVALVLALGAVGILAGRSLAAPGGELAEQGPAPLVAPCASPDDWRSDRWIRDAARQGIDELERWRRRPPSS